VSKLTIYQENWQNAPNYAGRLKHHALNGKGVGAETTTTTYRRRRIGAIQMTQDILNTRIETDMDPAYYAALLADCQQQLDASVRSEQRFATMVQTITEQRETLEAAMITAWDDSAAFALLKAEYEGLHVVFMLAPKAHAHHEKRSNALRLHAIDIKHVRDQASTAARYAAAEAKAEAERVERERVALAEQQQRIADKKAERELELAEQHARNAALYERQAADKQDSLSWLKRLTGTHNNE
jgi:hypothetical protein